MSKKNGILGYWRIKKMETWDKKFVDMAGPAYIEFDERGLGTFSFGLMQGWMDCRDCERDGMPAVEFSWMGNDEGDEVGGRGWVVLNGQELEGRIFVHRGDDSAFTAMKGREIRKQAKTKGKNKRK